MSSGVKKLKKDGTLSRQGEGGGHGSKDNVGPKKPVEKVREEMLKEALSIVDAEFWVKMAHDKAIPRLQKLLDSRETKDETLLRAIQEVLNRVLGKPTESLDLTSKGKRIGIPTQEQLDRFAKRNVKLD